MLKKLRFKMVFICSSVTVIILAIVSMTGFFIFDNHYHSETLATLENQLKSLTLCIQQQKTISHSYLSELQANYNLLIYIEDNGTSLLFKNYLESESMQKQLFEQAHSLAETEYNFNFNPYMIYSVELPSVFFEFEGINQKSYLAAVTVFWGENSMSQVLILKDLTQTKAYIFYIQLLFIGLTIIGTIFLVIFSFWFVDLTLKPIKLNIQKQAEFIAAASHELRAPLTVIEAGLSSLDHLIISDKQSSKSAQSTHFIHLMESEAKRMKRLISDLLILARSDAHQWHMQFAKSEIDTLLIELYDNFYSLYRDKHITLNLQLPEELLPNLIVDADRLKQALTILLDNALSYVPENKSVTLSAIPSSKHLDIMVIDTGIGINDEDKIHIFERFYQADHSRHEKNHYGLGLSIAYEITQLHHGKLLLTDTPGGGCTFTIRLPYFASSKNEVHSS